MQRPSGSVLAAAFLCGGIAAWAQQPVVEPVPAFRTGIELVAVDVGVVDRQGRPVRDLGPADFVVTVGGKARRVATAEFVDTAAARLEAASRPDLVPVSTNEGAGLGRQFVFVVDQNTLEAVAARQVVAAASSFLAGLTFNDRSALMLIPTGPNIEFTWAHDRVREAMKRVMGLSSQMNQWEYGSLTEARDIANRNPTVLREVEQRECGMAVSDFGGTQAAAGGTSAGGTAPTAPSGESDSGSQTGGATRGGGRSSAGSARAFGSSCAREIQGQADATWRTAQSTSLASLMALRQVLTWLARTGGDKTVFLISGGWPLDLHEQNSLVANVAEEAAAARATIFTLFVPETKFGASRRMANWTPASDTTLRSMPLDALASMTGGGAHRAEVGAEGVFERLGRELSGYYRIGVEKEPGDTDGDPRRLRVQVPRPGVTVRARGVFDARTYEDRNWTARLDSALRSPIPATGVGLRVTSYVSPDQDDHSRLKLVLAGEAFRLDPGEATFQLVVHDDAGRPVLSGEQPLGEPNGDGLQFSTSVAVPPGSYVIRVAVIDGQGRVGSVDHRVEAQRIPLGPLSATGPLLIRVPGHAGAEPRLALEEVHHDERLALQVELEGAATALAATQVEFEIAETTDGPALVHAIGALSPGSHRESATAQVVADMRILPAGHYVARAKVRSGTAAAGELRRAFTVVEAPRVETGAAGASPIFAGRPTSARAAAIPMNMVPAFAVDRVLAPQVLGGFLDRVSERSDADSPAIRELLERARSAGVRELVVPEAVAADHPVAAFLQGVALLSQHKLDPAAAAFRNAMRASADFFPAMVYLGACYAAAGKDREAAGAWRTALIKEGDATALHVLLAEAQLRQGRPDLALQTLDAARERWPADEALKRPFVLAALSAGEHADGLEALDELVAARAEDEPLLEVALLVLYEAFVAGDPIEGVEQDRARMARLAEAYRARGGQSLALVETWLAATTRQP
jgi:VWFA-related protein